MAAVYDVAAGQTWTLGPQHPQAEASIVKLDILCTLLYQDQRDGHAPSDADRTLITSMIESSDNDAAQHLYEEVGGASAIAAAHPRKLLEVLAADLVKHFLANDGISGVEVLLRKRILPHTDCVAVRMRRTK